jgi:hypothetical protein
MQARLPLFAAALWWGSLTAVGFMVVPLLFKYLHSPAMAGSMAARLFTAQTWLSVACGVALLLTFKSNRAPTPAQPAQAAMVFVILGMLLALLIEFAVAPHIVARDNLRLWHSVGTAMYAVQWLCATAVLWRLGRASRVEDQDERSDRRD